VPNSHPLLVALLLTSTSSAGLAQQSPAPETEQPVAVTNEAQPGGDAAAEDELEEEQEGAEIVVTGARQRGAVIGDIEPEIQFSGREVRALGASNIAELLQVLAPQTRSGRGRGGEGPVVLLNGRRISGFNEIRNLPPEAIQRVDVLPEEVALQYGFRADQRVVNFVLRPRFRAVTAELEGGLATDGGRESGEADVNILRITDTGRWNIDLEYERQAALLENERDIIRAETVSGVDLTEFRTLLPETESASLGGTLNRTILGDVSATLNGRFQATESESLFGLPTGTGADDADGTRPLTRETSSRNGRIGTVLNGRVAPWRWSLTGAYDRTTTTTLTDIDSAAEPRARDRARSVNSLGTIEGTANGPLFALPAGDVTTTLKAGFDTRDLSSRTQRGAVLTERDLGRDRFSGQASLDLPIADRSRGVLGALGDLSLNANLALEELSDFGTLAVYGAGLNWEPIKEVSFIASVTDEEGAPGIQQLGDPVLATPNVRVFDFVRGETVDLTRIEGGNPDLIADNRRVVKLGLNVRPFDDTDLSFSANYTDSRIENPIASFPTATAEIEAAFPDRFTRDASGRLVQIDSRPVNFARSDREEMRWGINFSKPLGPQPPPGGFRRRRAEGGAPGAGAGAGEAGAPGQGPRAGGPRGPGGGGFGRFGGFGGGRGGRLQLGLYHNWRFKDEILIREGVPALDLLNGSAVGSRGGQPEHEVELQANLFKNGLGARLTGSWQSGTFVRGVAGAGGQASSDLRFSDLTTLNLRLFADLGAQRSLVQRSPFFRGSRVSLSIDNLLGTRLQVRDAAGETPLGYQAGLLDPVGRSVRISFRKLFF
jgi:hypothetical protein